MARYRVLVDILDTKDMASSTTLNQIAEEIANRVTLAVDGEQRRNGLRVEVVAKQHGVGNSWHAHNGNSGCTNCNNQYGDGLT